MVKEVQSLNGKIAALNRFVLKATNKCLPFFRTMRKSFKWTNECQMAFDNLKVYLSSPPLLSPSKPGEEFYLYLAVSTALVKEEDGYKGVHGSCWVGLRGFFYPTHHGGSKKNSTQPNPSHKSNPTHIGRVGSG